MDFISRQRVERLFDISRRELPLYSDWRECTNAGPEGGRAVYLTNVRGNICNYQDVNCNML